MIFTENKQFLVVVSGVVDDVEQGEYTDVKRVVPCSNVIDVVHAIKDVHGEDEWALFEVLDGQSYRRSVIITAHQCVISA